MRIQDREEYSMRGNPLIALLVPAVLSAQPTSASLADSSPKFEVADVKPSDPSVVKNGKGESISGWQN